MKTFPLFVVAAVFTTVVGGIVSIIVTIIRYFIGEKAVTYLLVKPIKPSYKKALETYFTYYNELSPENKVIFEKRVQLFIEMKEFIPRGFDQVLDEMKTIIAASAIQLTFGLPQVYLKHFKKILIYPDDYYCRIFRRYHQGEVRQHGGIIILSWKNFARGYMDDTNGRNLGLHEMAHALRLENDIINGEHGFLDREALHLWHLQADELMEKINQGETAFFRKYAGTNIEEFFAVSVENFFERPDEFVEQYPVLYGVMAHLLKQDLVMTKRAKEGSIASKKPMVVSQNR